MVFRMKGHALPGPFRRVGIFEGVGEDRVRISKSEADKKEAAGATNITRTAADNPNIEEGKQQQENLGIRLSKLDAELQEEVDASYIPPENVWRGMADDEGNFMFDEGIEEKIRKHENLKGGDPRPQRSTKSSISSKTYRINGKEVSKEEYDKIMEKANRQ